MADSDNVIIFGAGTSFDAGIPLMAGFVEKMWEFAIRGQANGEDLSETKREIFRNAMKIKHKLDHYHGRALFDDRNLEDILSILSFNNIRNENNDLSDFVKAIAETIELTCEVKYQHESHAIQESGSKFYRRFWRRLFEWFKITKKFPILMSYNYDLVFERSLFQTLNNNIFTDETIPFKGLNINYHYGNNYVYQYSVKGVRRATIDPNKFGIKLVNDAYHDPLEIDILKLHGSLNFLRNGNDVKPPLTFAVEEPLILPPLFNKMSLSTSINQIWCKALNCLRNAKNVIIVGYSLPQTDIYMQYFLKSALGPNNDLHRIYVFDPILFKNNTTSEQMRNRYASCFSPQLQSRIIFKPTIPWESPSGEFQFEEDYIEKCGGTFRHFVDMLNEKNNILF